MKPSTTSVCENASNDTGTFFLGLIGCKGGQGTSMLASTLAGIASRGKKTVLVDLDGNSTHRHNLERDNCPGISNLAMVIAELPPHDIAGFIQRHPHGFDLLPGVKNPEEEHAIDPVKLSLIFKLLAEKYEVVLLDASSSHRFVSAELFRSCSLNLMIVQPDLLSLSCAVRLLDSSNRQNQTSPATWAIVVNKESAAALVKPHQVSEVLDLPLLAILPEDPVAAEDFSNLARAAARRTPYTAALEALAELLGLAESPGNTPGRSLSSRCLRALRTWTAGCDGDTPNLAGSFSKEGYSCAG